MCKASSYGILARSELVAPAHQECQATCPHHGETGPSEFEVKKSDVFFEAIYIYALLPGCLDEYITFYTQLHTCHKGLNKLHHTGCFRCSMVHLYECKPIHPPNVFFIRVHLVRLLTDLLLRVTLVVTQASPFPNHRLPMRLLHRQRPQLGSLGPQ